MNASKKTIAVMIGSAFVASVGVSTVSAAENPFALKPLSSGYMVADADKAGEGKCGAEKKAEGSCGGDKAKEGACHADKSKEGSCHADKSKEGSCHADKEGAGSAE